MVRSLLSLKEIFSPFNLTLYNDCFSGVSISQPLKTLEGLKEMVKKEKYQNLEFEFIKAPEEPKDESKKDPDS